MLSITCVFHQQNENFDKNKFRSLLLFFLKFRLRIFCYISLTLYCQKAVEVGIAILTSVGFLNCGVWIKFNYYKNFVYNEEMMPAFFSA